MAQYKGASEEARRAQQMMQRREQEKQQLEDRKRKIVEEMHLGDIDGRFSAHFDSIEQTIKAKTVGLVTLDEMKATQQKIVEEREKEYVQRKRRRLAGDGADDDFKLKPTKIKTAVLSFQVDDDVEESNDQEDVEANLFNIEADVAEIPIASELHALPPTSGDNDADESESLPLTDKNHNDEADASSLHDAASMKRRLGKNPDVDTSFLPDHDREENDKRLREQLRLEWQQKQEQTKREPVEIVFSYWDGSGHRRSVTMRKGDTIFQFLCKAHEILKREFNELRTAMPDQLVYVKEDLILPHHYSFYDFIITKARGKSGPLFSFDVHEDIRFLSDAKKEKNESHAGKVVLRSWYERNKHIFPASRWEPWDPHRRYDKYTIKDKK